MAGSVLDSHMQFAVIQVGFTTAASGNVFAQLATGLTNMQKIAWAIKRLEYFFSYGSLNGMAAQDTFTRLALTQSAALTGFDPRYSPLVDNIELYLQNAPAADNARVMLEMPFVHEFSGEDKLIVPQNVYAQLNWLHSVAPAGTEVAHIRMWYREIELSSADWYDLLQLRLPLGAL